VGKTPSAVLRLASSALLNRALRRSLLVNCQLVTLGTVVHGVLGCDFALGASSSWGIVHILEIQVWASVT